MNRHVWMPFVRVRRPIPNWVVVEPRCCGRERRDERLKPTAGTPRRRRRSDGAVFINARSGAVLIPLAAWTSFSGICGGRGGSRDAQAPGPLADARPSVGTWTPMTSPSGVDSAPVANINPCRGPSGVLNGRPWNQY